MFCIKCGKEINNNAKFCSSCGAETVSASFENNPTSIPIKKKSKAIIKCGNCEYIGSGESARRKIFTIMAWFCVWFAPMITIIYYLATYKYKCPKCNSTFLGVKNKEGTFVGQKGGAGRIVLIFITVIFGIAIIGILASAVLVSLNSAREKAEQTMKNAAQNNFGAQTYDWSCGDVISYFGQNYDTVQIGSQCWFKENLNVGVRIAGKSNASNNGIIEKYCYDNNDTNCATDGGLYQWDEAMAYSNIEGAQGICPSGWHIPKDSEWYILENYLKDIGQSCLSIRNGVRDCYNAGIKLQKGGSSGLDGILVGYRGRGINDSFFLRGTLASLWSSTENGSNAWDRDLYSGDATVIRLAYVKALGFSVRCLKD